MSVIVCPWCQSEITQEPGEEPEKYCPICENELDGYRTLRIGIGGDSEDEEEAEEADAADVSASGEEELSWVEDGDLTEKSEALIMFEENVQELLDVQDAVPECPQCREFMLEAGEQWISSDQFRARVPESLGEPLLQAPFALTVYVCPSCFTVQHSLAEQGRFELARKLSAADASAPTPKVDPS